MLYHDQSTNPIVEAARLITESTNAKQIEILTFLYTGGSERQKTDVIKKEVGYDKNFDSAMKVLESQSLVLSTSSGVSITKKGVSFLLKKHPELEESFDLDEMTDDELDGVLSQLVDEGYDLDEIDESVVSKAAGVAAGLAALGARKVGKKVAKGARERLTRSGRADRAERKADDAEKKQRDKDRIKAAKQRKRDAKRGKSDD